MELPSHPGPYILPSNPCISEAVMMTWLSSSPWKILIEPHQPQSPVIPAGNRGLVLDLDTGHCWGHRYQHRRVSSCQGQAHIHKPVSQCDSVLRSSGFAGHMATKTLSDAYHQQQTLGAKRRTDLLKPHKPGYSCSVLTLGPAVNSHLITAAFSPNPEPIDWCLLHLIHQPPLTCPAPLKII